MRNERLRRALDAAGLTTIDLALVCDVDPKTAERWVTQGRPPFRRHQLKIAEATGVPTRELWPAASRESPDLIALYPHRGAVPVEMWLQLLSAATEHVAVLAWAATFFHQVQPHVAALLAGAAERGATVRLCFGHPSGAALAARELEEPLLGPGVLAGKVRVSLGYYRDLVDVDGVEIRLHDAVVYASLFRYDDEMIVNPHIYGRPASENPALHLRHGSVFDRYAASFDAVWEAAESWKGEQV